MTRWPDTLAGRTLSLLVGMTLLLLIGSALLLQDERKDRFEERNLSYLVDEVTTLVSLLQDADPAERARIVERFAQRGDDIELTDRPRLPPSWPWRHAVEHSIHHKLRAALGIEDRESLRVSVQIDERNRGQARNQAQPHEQSPPYGEPQRSVQMGEHVQNGAQPHARPPAHTEPRPENLRTGDVKGIAVSVRLRDGTWVNIQTSRIDKPPPWAGKTLQLLGLLLLMVIACGLLIARRMAHPMAQLAAASHRFGLGQIQPLLAEKGPREVRQTIHAFNLMQERLHRHLQERSRLLAAVSHDLRTPITILRLRAEYIDDAEMREKTLATLAEMEAILSATLHFARDEAADETTRATDLTALVQSLVDDQADLGSEVGYDGPDRSIFHCRPIALKRALSNLIDNAVKYGGTVRVMLSEESGGRRIVIDDDGPGIPEDELEKVFEPFVRLDASRNRETGGTGLGLSVARTIVHAQGGTLRLDNRSGGGLRAVVWLPE